MASKTTKPVFHRGEHRDWGEGEFTCPFCDSKAYCCGVVWEKTQAFHCKGLVEVVLIAERTRSP